MRSQVSGITLRRAALFIALAAGVAAIVVFAGRELGWGGQAARGQTGPPMTLSLSAAPTCETERGQGYAGSELRDKPDGSVERVSVFDGYFGVAETDVTWSVSGGTAPYTLVIDGETRDAVRHYRGATGTASVSCALEPGETFIDRRDGRGYRSNPPKVDSGLKTIRATVTDASGAQAEAALDIYVILVVEGAGIPLNGGKTYRIHGFLLTIPENVDMEIGGHIDEDCEGSDCEDYFHILAMRDGYEVGAIFGMSTGKAYPLIWIDDRPRGASEASPPTEGRLNAIVDDLVESLGQAPQINRD